MPLIRIKSFNGYVLDNANYAAYGKGLSHPADAKPVFIEQTEADALFSGTFTRDARNFGVEVDVKKFTDRYELHSELAEALKPGTEGLLVAYFADEQRNYQVNCVVQSVVPSNRWNLVTIIFQTGESAWRTVTEETDMWAVDASGDTKTLIVGGYSETRLSMTLTPTELPATGWAYQNLYQLINEPLIGFGLRPWEILIDTAALVTAGKMQADGDDIRVIVDGIEVNRWLADINTDHTKIWFNVNLAAGQTLSLLTAIAAAGSITSMSFEKTKNNAAALKLLPARGYLVHGTEWLEYTGKDMVNYKLTGITRGALGTTLQAHSAADVFSWIEHSVFVLYGNGTATAPALTDLAYDDTKPVFDLAASTNESWVYTASTKFYDPAKPNRTGAWTPSITKVGNESELYIGQGNVEGGAPVMGMQISTWWKNNRATAEKASLAWQLQNPGGITTVSMTGRKYRSSTLWPATKAAILQRSLNLSAWYEVWSELTPSAAATWEAITHAAAAITSNMPIVRFIFAGTLAASADVDTFFEIQTLTVVFVSANQPSGALLGEKGNYLLNVLITNSTNGDAVRLLIPMLLNTVMDVDGEAYTITYNGVEAGSSLALNDESRDVWIRLVPGVNELVITGEDVAVMTVGLSWLERRI